jgi:hypothetical protein
MDKLVISQRQKIQFSDEDIQQLKQTGRLDKVLKVGEGVNERQYFVAVDKELNKLAFAPTSTFAFLDKVKVVSLTQPERLDLLKGKEVTTTLMKGQDAGVQVKIYLDPVRKNLNVNRIEPPKAQKAAQKQKAVMSNALKEAVSMSIAPPIQEQAPAKTKTQRMGV